MYHTANVLNCLHFPPCLGVAFDFVSINLTIQVEEKNKLLYHANSVANAAVYPPNWATLKLPTAGKKIVGRVA